MQTIKNQGEKLLRFEKCGFACRAVAGRAANGPEVRLFCVFLLVIAWLVSGCRPPGARALIKGIDLLEKGKCEQAVSELRTATSLLKTNAIAFNYLGLALHQSGQLTEAEAVYHRALALNHELAEARYNLGCLFLAENKIEQAKSELTAYTLRRPDAPEGWTRLATAQLRSREPQAAERSFTQALRLKPQDPESLTGIGLARLQRNRPAEAVQWFNNALKEKPDYAPALLNLAVVAQENLRDKPLALRHYRLYLALKTAREDSAAVQKIAQQLEQELAPAAVATTIPPSSQVQKSSNASLVKSGVVERTTPVSAPQPSTLPSTNAPAAERTALTNKAQSSTIEVAAKAAPLTSETRPQPPAVPPRPAEPIALSKSTPPARASVPPSPLQVVEVPDDQVFKAVQDMPARGSSQAPSPATSAGNAKTQTLAPAAAKPPKRGFLSKINPARIFSSDDGAAAATPSPSGRAASAGPQTEAADPPKPQATSGSPAIARYKYLSPAKPKPGDRPQAERAYAQGVEAEKSRRLSLAIEAYQRATQLDPAYYEAYYNLGVAAAANGELPAALAAYEHALAIEDRLDARYNFALALKQSNFPIDARIQLEKVLAMYPNESRAHLALANLYAQQFHDLAKAREHYLKVLETDPQNTQAGAIRYWLTENPPR